MGLFLLYLIMKKLLILCLLLCSVKTQAQNVLTVGSVYNYEAGDVICTRSHWPSNVLSWPMPIVQTILAKAYNSDSSAVTYTIEAKSYYVTGNPPNFDTLVNTNTGTHTVNDLDSIIGKYNIADSTYFFPNIPFCPANGIGFSTDSILSDTSGFDCNFETRTWETMGCSMDFEPCTTNITYINGIGGPFGHFHYPSEYCDGNYTFIYSIKNNGQDTCGVYMRLATGITENVFDNNLVIYPNPTNGTTTILAKAGIIKYALLVSSQGANLQEFTAISGPLTIDLSTYPTGLYFIRLVDGKGLYHTKKLIRE